MNDDLMLLISCYAKGYGLTKIALKIKHGLNDEFWSENWKYYREDNVIGKYRELLPEYLLDMVDEILKVEDIYCIV